MEKIEFLKSLDFSEYESKALASLISLKQATAKQIHEHSDVPQNKLYAILKSFENNGLLASILGESKKYKLINLKSFINKKLAEKEEFLKKLKKSSEKIEYLKDNEVQSVFSLIKGQQAVMNKLAEHNPKVEKEILGVQRNWKFWGEGIRAMEKCIKRGVKARLIGVINKETEQRAKQWKEIGCNIKKYNPSLGENPLRFTIFDNKIARITIGKPEIKNPQDYITIWTKSKPLINILRKQFMQMWKECERF